MRCAALEENVDGTGKARLGDLIRPEIRCLSPYNAGLTIAEVEARYHPPSIAKLGSNENPLGPSPKVQALFWCP